MYENYVHLQISGYFGRCKEEKVWQEAESVTSVQFYFLK